MSESHFDLFVNKIQSLSPETLVKIYLFNLEETVKILKPFESRLPELLATLEDNTIGYLIILLAKLTLNETDFEVIGCVRTFVNGCDGQQILLDRSSYYELFHLFAKVIVDRPEAMQGIKILSTAIDKVRKNRNQLTPIHSDLCLLSLKAKNFRTALEYLKDDVYEIDTGVDNYPIFEEYEQVNLNAKYVLLYFYYGGMIYTATKNYENALFFFEACASTPCMQLSKIMVEAYKKLILVSLIHHGRFKCLTDFINESLLNNLSEMKPYNELLNAYQISRANVEAVVGTYTGNFISDVNFGLVKLVLKSLYKKKVKQLAETHSTISLNDLHLHGCIPDDTTAEKFLLKLSMDNEINIQIDEKSRVVRFEERPRTLPTEEMYQQLEKEMEVAMKLNKQVTEMNNELSVDPKYIRLMAKKSSSATDLVQIGDDVDNGNNIN